MRDAEELPAVEEEDVAPPLLDALVERFVVFFVVFIEACLVLSCADLVDFFIAAAVDVAFLFGSTFLLAAGETLLPEVFFTELLEVLDLEDFEVLLVAVFIAACF